MIAKLYFPATRPPQVLGWLPQVVGWLMLSGLGWAVIGCGPSGPQRVAVSGSVTLDGRPVNNATIIFTPQGPGLAAAAMIDDGKFVLSDLDGPTSGEHRIRINPNEADMEQASPAELALTARRPKIPKVYQADGQLQAVVTGESQQHLSFELTSNY
jgi:hypothetical protein